MKWWPPHWKERSSSQLVVRLCHICGSIVSLIKKWLKNWEMWKTKNITVWEIKFRRRWCFFVFHIFQLFCHFLISETMSIFFNDHKNWKVFQLRTFLLTQFVKVDLAYHTWKRSYWCQLRYGIIVFHGNTHNFDSNHEKPHKTLFEAM